MTDTKDLEFLAIKSKELIDKQIASHRQQHTTASSIIAIVALFIPLFLSGLDDAVDWVKYISIIPIILLVSVVCCLLFYVFRANTLSQALNFNKFQELINNQNFETTLLYEIGANKSSFQDNKILLERRTKYYNYAVLMTIWGIVLSVGLLLANKFLKPAKKKEPTQVEIINKVAILDSLKKRDTVFIVNPIRNEKSKVVVRRRKCCPQKNITINQTIENQTIENQVIKNN